QLPDPNGLCFSPDYKRLYVISTGKGPGDTGPGGKRDMHVFVVGPDNKLSNQRLFTDFMVDGIKCGPDGARCDVDGNVWVSSNAFRELGYSGVTVWTPEGKLIGRIRLWRASPICASADPSVTGSSWPPASRSMRSIPGPREPRRDDRGNAAACRCGHGSRGSRNNSARLSGGWH